LNSSSIRIEKYRRLYTSVSASLKERSSSRALRSATAACDASDRHQALVLRVERHDASAVERVDQLEHAQDVAAGNLRHDNVLCVVQPSRPGSYARHERSRGDYESYVVRCRIPAATSWACSS